MLQDRADKICEMANVMQKSIQIDEENMAKEQELMARLATENKVGPIKKPMVTLHRGSSSICWVLVRDLAIEMHFFGVRGFLCMKTTS